MTSLSALVPGPNSTELVMHVGYARAGWLGLFACGFSFVTPAIAVVIVLAAAFTALPEGVARGSAIAWANAALLGVVATAFAPLLRSIAKAPTRIALLAGALAAFSVGMHELVPLLAAGVVAVALGPLFEGRTGRSSDLGSGPQSGPANAVLPPWEIFLAFLKIGAFLYGSGYVLLAWIDRAFGPTTGLLTRDEVLASIAAGQLTPGPLFSSAGFVGYLLAGWSGALAASLGIFLPAFAFVALTAPFAARIAGSGRISRFVDGVGLASFALLLFAAGKASYSLARDVPVTLGVTVVAAVLLLWRKWNPMLVVLLAGGMGTILALLSATRAP